MDQIEIRLAETVSLVKKGVELQDDSYFLRALRRTGWIRKQKNAEIKKAFDKYLPSKLLKDLFSKDPSVMDVEDAQTPKKVEEILIPEVELYLLHTIIHIAKVNKTSSREVLLSAARSMMDRGKSQERRTMDVLRARAWHTFSLIHESPGGTLDEEIRKEILEAHRSACLRLDESGQAVTINLILRDLVSRNLISDAAKFASKAHFPDRASNNMQVRHLYFMARIEALQLEYGKALNLVQQAIRKTPTSCGRGFRLKLFELATVVTLLTGETPERAWYSDDELGDALAPYFDLVKAVRVGNVQAFELCQKVHGIRYEKDGTQTLVQRLHSSVIKTGLKAIGAAYSRISFPDVAHKLELDPADSTREAALFLCAKAIRDGVLDASIDPDGLWLCSSDQIDVYSSTADPQKAYQRRINFLLQVHNDAVKSLRFPPDAHKTVNRPTQEREETEIEDLEETLAGEDD